MRPLGNEIETYYEIFAPARHNLPTKQSGSGKTTDQCEGAADLVFKGQGIVINPQEAHSGPAQLCEIAFLAVIPFRACVQDLQSHLDRKSKIFYRAEDRARSSNDNSTHIRRPVSTSPAKPASSICSDGDFNGIPYGVVGREVRGEICVAEPLVCADCGLGDSEKGAEGNGDKDGISPGLLMPIISRAS
jgi:hypothetical protein